MDRDRSDRYRGTGTDTAGLRLASATITPNGKYWALSIAKLFSDLYVVDGLR